MTDIADVAGRTVVAGATGFAAGGPIGALVGVATQLVPELIRSLAGDGAGQVAQQVAGVVQAVAQTDDPLAAAAALSGDPAKALEARVRLTEIAVAAEEKRRQAELEMVRMAAADAANARAMSAGSPEMARAQIRIGYSVLAVFAAVLLGVWWRGIPSGAESVLNILLGMLGGAVLSVVAFFFGGSVGSQEKTGLMAQFTAAVARLPSPITTSTPVAASPVTQPRRSIFNRS